MVHFHMQPTHWPIGCQFQKGIVVRNFSLFSFLYRSMTTLELSLKAAQTDLTGHSSPTWLSLSSSPVISQSSNVPQLLGRLSYPSLLFPIDSFVRIVPFSTLHHSTSWTVAQMDGLVE